MQGILHFHGFVRHSLQELVSDCIYKNVTELIDSKFILK